MTRRMIQGAILPAAFALALLLPLAAAAHCDTLDGPVVADARFALEKGDVTIVLKWIRPEAEAQIRDAFKKTLAVRAKGPEAKDLADTYFFETLVRIHRAGEGAPFTGLKPAGEVDPGIAAADKAIASGSIAGLEKHLTEAVAAGLRSRYAELAETAKAKDASVEAGRRYVAAYVTFIHYVEGILGAAERPAAHGGDPAAEHAAPAQTKTCPHAHE